MARRIIVHVIRKVTVCNIADGTDFAGMCEIYTDDFIP
jgi:hypothetical protein